MRRSYWRPYISDPASREFELRGKTIGVVGLGAIGEGDIGSYFPPGDPQWKNVPSRIFLEKASELVGNVGGAIVNIDATLIAEAPKILPHVPAMKIAVAQALYISPDQIGIKATTNELLGFLGREEGMAAMAVAAVNLPQ